VNRGFCAVADARSVLEFALEGLAPTSEFPEIEEASKFLAAINVSAQLWVFE
jgi:hypothetical protein